MSQFLFLCPILVLSKRFSKEAENSIDTIDFKNQTLKSNINTPFNSASVKNSQLDLSKYHIPSTEINMLPINNKTVV